MRRQCTPGDFRRIVSLRNKLILMGNAPGTQCHVIEYDPQKSNGLWQNAPCEAPSLFQDPFDHVMIENSWNSRRFWGPGQI